MLAAIGVRETGFRNIAEAGGGGGRGVFQIDIHQNRGRITEAQAFDIAYAAGWVADRLADNAKALAEQFGLAGPRLWEFVLASYNAGLKGVTDFVSRQLARGLSIDQVVSADAITAFGNYGRNVLHLMECFK
jgi:hypothetical protein